MHVHMDSFKFIIFFSNIALLLSILFFCVWATLPFFFSSSFDFLGLGNFFFFFFLMWFFLNDFYFYFLNLGDYFFFLGYLLLFCFNPTSFFNKSIWVNFFELIFLSLHFSTLNQTNKRKNKNLFFSILQLFYTLSIFYSLLFYSFNQLNPRTLVMIWQ